MGDPMKNFKKTIIWSICILVVVATASYFAMDMGVNYVLKSMSSESKDKASETSETSETLDTSLTSTPDIISKPDETKESVSAAESSEEVETGEDIESAAPKETKSGSSSSSDSSDLQDSTDSSSPTTKSNSTPSKKSDKETSTEDQSNDTYTGEITPEKVERAEEEITFREKTRVTTVLLKNLSSSDIKKFMSMSGQEVSVTEKKAAKKVFLEKLSEEEYNDLIAIAAKLGLSQGLSYEESLKQFE
jgi:low affinity Fe/Cu permease